MAERVRSEKLQNESSPNFSDSRSEFCCEFSLNFSGSRKGGYLKGFFAQSRLFYREMDCPVRWSQGNGLPRAVVTRHPLGLGKLTQSRAGLGSCKSHLQVQTPQGRSLASASGSGQAIDLCFERSPFK